MKAAAVGFAVPAGATAAVSTYAVPEALAYVASIVAVPAAVLRSPAGAYLEVVAG